MILPVLGERKFYKFYFLSGFIWTFSIWIHHNFPFWFFDKWFYNGCSIPHRHESS